MDQEAADRLVSRYAELARLTRRPEVLADVGPFGGLFKLGSYREPVLVASTDNVGTKVKLAGVLGRYQGLGEDLVNQSVNDILCSGAEPLFFLDYIGSYGLPDETKVDIVRGVVSACRAVGCALLGGETATQPGVYAAGDFDLVGFVVGIVERDRIIDGSHIKDGDVLLAMRSSGLHTNGYSLVRKVFGAGLGRDIEEERAALDRNYPGLGLTLGEELLKPHRCYYNELKPLLPILNGIAHITGGGLPGNLPRMLPEGLAARIDKAAWKPQRLFRLIQERGDIAEEEMYRTFNMGLGIVLAVSPENAEAVRSHLPEARVVGDVAPREDEAFVWA